MLDLNNASMSGEYTAPADGPVLAFLRCSAAIASVVLFFTNLDDYLFTWSLAPAPSVFAVALGGIAALLILGDPRRGISILRSPVGGWLLAYLLVTTLWALPMTNRPELVQELVTRYRSMGILLVLGILYDDERARRLALWTIVGAVLFASVVHVAEAASLIRFADINQQRTAGRAAGLYFNANAAGFAITIGLAVGLEMVPRGWRLPLLVLGTFGVLATFSRGSVLCLSVVIGWVAWRRALGKGHLVFAVAIGAILAVAAIGFLQSHDLLNENTWARLHFSKDDSGRVYLVMKAWRLFASSPILGNGLGCTLIWDEPVRAHNMFATLAADHGILGLLLFPALGFALVRSNRRALCLTVVLMVAGMFSHNVLEDRYVLVVVALASIPERSGARDGQQARLSPHPA